MRSSSPFALWRFESLLQNSEPLLGGLLRTILVATLALLLALAIGIVIGLFSTSQTRILKGSHLRRVFPKYSFGDSNLLYV